MTDTTCKFCDKTFVNKYTLASHQRKSQNCLEIQRQIREAKDGEPVILEKSYTCSYCLITVRNSYKNQHLSSCKQRRASMEKKEIEQMRQENEQMRQEIMILKKEVEYAKAYAELEIYKNQSTDSYEYIKRLGERPTNTNTNANTNNTTNNISSKIFTTMKPLDLDDSERIKSIIQEEFTSDYLVDGQTGVAKFLVDKVLKDDEGQIAYICTDVSRYIFKYKHPDGYIGVDANADKLISQIAFPIMKKSADLVCHASDECSPVLMQKTEKVNDLRNNNFKLKSSLASATNAVNYQ